MAAQFPPTAFPRMALSLQLPYRCRAPRGKNIMMRKAKPSTVLVADEDADNRQMTREAFEQARVANDLRFVENGAELMDYLHHRDKFKDPALSPPPGLILLDLNMPLKDGREALREIKADPRLKSIRIVIMTTSQAEEDIQRTYDLTATSYITKP